MDTSDDTRLSAEVEIETKDALREAFDAGIPLVPQFQSGAYPTDLLGPTFHLEPAGMGDPDGWLEDGFSRFAVLLDVRGRNGLVYSAVDVDAKNGRNGFDHLAALGLEPGEGFATPNGGRHYLFAGDESLGLKSVVDPEGFEGVEVKTYSVTMFGDGYEPLDVVRILPISRFPVVLREHAQTQRRTEPLAGVAVEGETLISILDSLGIVDVIPRAEWINFPCPFHDDETPSSGLSLEHGGFNCFVCGGMSLEAFYAHTTTGRERLGGADYSKARRTLRKEFNVTFKSNEPETVEGDATTNGNEKSSDATDSTEDASRESSEPKTVELTYETTEHGTRYPVVNLTAEEIIELRTETAELLDWARGYISEYVYLDKAEQYDALALWVLHTWAFDAARTTPYIHFTAPEENAGKSRALEVLKWIVRNGWKFGGGSASSLYRRMDKEYVTLLLDEIDMLMERDGPAKAAIIGILNDGYHIGGVYTLSIAKGNDWESKDFDVFAPKAFAGIGRNLPPALASRCIRIEMRRTRAQVADFMDEQEQWAKESGFIAEVQEWAARAVPMLKPIEVRRIPELSDRAFNVWRPLLQIAAFAKPSWESRGEAAAIELSAASAIRQEEKLHTLLLRDIHAIFERDKRITALPTEGLRYALADDVTSPWYHWKQREEPVTAKVIADLLAKYDIHPEPEGILFSADQVARLAKHGVYFWKAKENKFRKTTAETGEQRARGYLRSNFEGAWESWL